MGRKFRESMVRRDRQGQFASKAGGWLSKVSHAIDRQLGGGGGRGADANFSAPASPAKARSARPAMTDEEFEARAAMVSDVIGKARKTLATEHTHTDESGAWNAERDRLHQQIADELYSAAAHVPNERRAVIAGGLGGAGKTTVLTKHAGVNTREYLTLNPDDVKELMAERGLIPEVPGHPDLSPMERAALVHEESSRITSMVAERALRDGKNMMWDITMASERSAQTRIDDLKARGYREIKGVFVDIPVEVSVSRAMSRYRRGADQHRAGKGPGGRYVPPAIIRAQRTSTGETINRGVFERLKGEFTEWSMYDNSVAGSAPKLIKKRSRVSQGARDFMAAASAPASPPSGGFLEWPRSGRA